MTRQMLRAPLLLAAMALGLGACGSLQVQSQWRSVPMAVDGRDGQWVDVESDKLYGLTLRAANDADDLYVFISADDPELKHQLCGGLPWTLRFTQADGRRVGLQVGPHPLPLGAGDPLDDPLGGLAGAGVSAAIVGVLPLNLEARDAYWLGPTSAAPQGPLDADRDGVEVADHDLYGTQVVELKIPLLPCRPGGPALDVRPGQALGLRLELPPQSTGSWRSPSAMAGRRRHGARGLGGGLGPGLDGDADWAPEPEAGPPPPVAAVVQGTLWLAPPPRQKGKP